MVEKDENGRVVETLQLPAVAFEHAEEIVGHVRRSALDINAESHFHGKLEVVADDGDVERRRQVGVPELE